MVIRTPVCCPVAVGLQDISEGPGILITPPSNEPTVSNTGVLSVSAGNSGITVAPTTGNVVVTNNGIISITQGVGITAITDSNGNTTISIPATYPSDISAGKNIVVAPIGPADIVSLAAPFTSPLNIGSQALQNTLGGTGVAGQLLQSTTPGSQTTWISLSSLLTAGTNITIGGTATNPTVGLATPLTSTLDLSAVAIRDTTGSAGTLNQILTTTGTATRWRDVSNLVITGTGLTSSVAGGVLTLANAGILDVSAGANITVTFPIEGTARIALSNPLSADLNLGIQRVLDASGLPGIVSQVLTSVGPVGGTLWRSATSLSFTGMDASGGNEIRTFNIGQLTYRAHTFTSSGTFQINSLGTSPNTDNPTIDMLIVGGGGSGGSPQSGAFKNGGGGGGGGVLYFENVPIMPRTPRFPHTTPPPPYSISITVGNGGTAVQGVASDVQGNDGGGSSVAFPQTLFMTAFFNNTLTVTAGGGGGGSGGTVAGRSGGSGHSTYLSAGTNLLASTGGGGGGSSGNITNSAAGAGGFYMTSLYGDPQGLSFGGGGKQGGPGNINAGTLNAAGGGGGARGQGFPTGTAGLALTVCSPGGAGLRTRLDSTVRFVGGGGEGAGTTRSATIRTGQLFGGGRGYASGDASPAATAGATTRGGGGGGAGAGQLSGAGGSGLVIIRYRI